MTERAIHLNELDRLTHPANGEVELANAGVWHLWVPSEELLFFTIPKPAAPRHKWAQLLPWILEDQLLEPPEGLHFTCFPLAQAQQLGVIVLRRAVLQRWLDELALADLQVVSITPDILALPWQAGQRVALWLGSRLLVRRDECSGFAAQGEDGLALLAHLDSHNSDLQQVNAVAKEQAIAPPQWGDAVVRLDTDAMFSHLPGQLPNLLHGTFQPQRRSVAVAHWRWPAWAALAALLLWVGWLELDTRALQQRQADFEAATKRDLQQLFGAGFSADSSNLRQLVERRMQVRQGGAADAVWPWLLRFDQALALCPQCRVVSLQAESGLLQGEIAGAEPGPVQAALAASGSAQLQWQALPQAGHARFELRWSTAP